MPAAGPRGKARLFLRFLRQEVASPPPQRPPLPRARHVRRHPVWAANGSAHVFW